MSSRDKILLAVKANQPALAALPNLDILKGAADDAVEKFTVTLTSIGGQVIKITSFDEVATHLGSYFGNGQRIANMVPELSKALLPALNIDDLPHTLENIELAILRADIGVAENGAVWLNESRLGQRVTPFICQHLAVILDEKSIVSTMHHAYDKIGNERYDFATFIAGPSKTADIEQSLVLGAHGARSMTVFLRDI